MFNYNDVSRRSQVILPSGQNYGLGYDANGNRTSITMPSGAVLGLGYNKVNLDNSYMLTTSGQRAKLADYGNNIILENSLKLLFYIVEKRNRRCGTLRLIEDLIVARVSHLCPKSWEAYGNLPKSTESVISTCL